MQNYSLSPTRQWLVRMSRQAYSMSPHKARPVEFAMSRAIEKALPTMQRLRKLDKDKEMLWLIEGQHVYYVRSTDAWGCGCPTAAMMGRFCEHIRQAMEAPCS